MSGLLISAVVLLLRLAGCDATGSEENVILKANSLEAPTVEYTFLYETNGATTIEVQSGNTDNLDAILSTNGFRRDDVVSARIDSVQLIRMSPKGKPIQTVFDNLTGTTRPSSSALTPAPLALRRPRSRGPMKISSGSRCARPA